MAKAARSLGTIAYPVRIERIRPTFTPLASLAQLDLAKVARAARLDIEVGYLSAGHCRQLVRATVKKGMVTGIEIEPCAIPTERRPPRDIVELVRKAHRAAVRRAGSRPPRPMPIRPFLRRAALIIIETITCFRICLGPFCVYCCTKPGGGLVCGAEVVVLPPIIIDI